MRIFVTGCNGLIGSEIVEFFDARARLVVGVDNNMRADFFGPEGDTRWNLDRLQRVTRNFQYRDFDVRDRSSLARLFRKDGPFDLIVHSAGQPSHDLAASRPFDDFDVNATGTLNVLETARQLSPDAVFVHLSTNKVYGDAPNELPLVELPRRWDYADQSHHEGIAEDMRIDRSKHSIFGASKVAADIMVQEYGRYFGMRTTCLRCSCLTGPAHSGVELHGFLSYLVKSHMMGRNYRVFGYRGKQVRDNIHSHDMATAVEQIFDNPRSAEVYNIGGGRPNSCSILEVFDRLQELTGNEVSYEYVDTAREGDHVCYISNLGRLRSHYPDWQVTRSLDDILRGLVDAWRDRLAQGPER